jgi:hypothetical protein
MAEPAQNSSEAAKKIKSGYQVFGKQNSYLILYEANNTGFITL